MREICHYCRHYLRGMNFCSNTKSLLYAAPVTWNETCPLWAKRDGAFVRFMNWLERILE